MSYTCHTRVFHTNVVGLWRLILYMMMSIYNLQMLDSVCFRVKAKITSVFSITVLLQYYNNKKPDGDEQDSGPAKKCKRKKKVKFSLNQSLKLSVSFSILQLKLLTQMCTFILLLKYFWSIRTEKPECTQSSGRSSG